MDLPCLRLLYLCLLLSSSNDDLQSLFSLLIKGFFVFKLFPPRFCTFLADSLLLSFSEGGPWLSAFRRGHRQQQQQYISLNSTKVPTRRRSSREEPDDAQL